MSEKYTVGTCIDIKAMMASERKKREQNKKVLQVNREAAFNLLMDMRHLLILDIRSASEFSSSRIRSSMWFDSSVEDETELLTNFIKWCKKSQDNLISTDDELRRILVITAEPNEDIGVLKKIFEGTQAFHKIMQLKNGYSDFESKYHFVCISDESSEDDIKRAEARFPSEILSDKLFMGNFINSVNKEHFKKLNISTILEVSAQKAEKQEDEKIDRYIDFKVVETKNKLSDEEEGEDFKEGATLIYSFNGYFAAAVWIKILMNLKKWPKEIAAATIMSKRPDVKDIPTSLFMQIDTEEFEKFVTGLMTKIGN